MGKIIVTLFLLADNPCGMKPSVTMSSVLLRHPSSALFLEKCRKCSVSAVFEGWVQMNPLMNPVGSKAEGKLNCINAVVITQIDCLICLPDKSGNFLAFRAKTAQNALKPEKTGFGMVNETAPGPVFCVFRSKILRTFYFKLTEQSSRKKLAVGGFEPKNDMIK